MQQITLQSGYRNRDTPMQVGFQSSRLSNGVWCRDDSDCVSFVTTVHTCDAVCSSMPIFLTVSLSECLLRICLTSHLSVSHSQPKKQLNTNDGS